MVFGESSQRFSNTGKLVLKVRRRVCSMVSPGCLSEAAGTEDGVRVRRVKGCGSNFQMG